ncbi:unnamed protein product [Symbiodinium sp. CCMP2592]|nr:unnamed protein product [Symbiodinium sp. CCMP2592]
MNARELQSLYADLSQRLNVPVSGQFVPERLGQSPPDLNVPAFVRHQGNTLPGVPAENARSSEDKDVFSRSEKWLGSPPSPNHQAWKGRESEVLGMNAYIHELVAWANQASVEFGKEIAQAARWPTQIAWNTLSKSQQARGVRLFSVLKAAFADHGRITLMIQSFGEGLDIVAVAMQGDVFGNSLSYMGNGFELLRQLAKEFSLRSRAEAMSLRAMLMARTFRAQDSSAPVADTVRQIEVAVARFVRLLSTLDPRDAAGFALTDSDQLTLLMRSLPESAKAYTLHHSQGETYASYRSSALRWEHQQRLFLELQGAKGLFGLHETEFSESAGSPEAGEGMDGHVFGMSARPSDAGSGVKCNRCGKKGHQVNQCTADLSKVKCFKCGEMGHISLNCAKGKQGDVSQSSARPKGSDGKGAAAAKGQVSFSPKGKSKGKGGKKGKMFALFDEETGVWWYTDADESFYTEEGDEQEAQQVDSTLVLSCVIELTDEPNTRFEAVLEDSESVSVVLQEQLCQPLLQSLGQSLGSEFWLLDSGASCCVINHVTLKTLPHDELTACGSTFMAANGTPVPFDGRCHVVLKVRTKDSSGATKNGVCKIPVMVGDTPYNILSTRTLGRHGWRVVLDEGVSVCHVKSGVDMIDTCIWCDTPWIRVIPHSEGDLLLPSDASVDPAPISSIGHVAVVSQKTKEDLEIHRAKGHMPFHPDCEHCLKSRGVTQHRRKSERGVETEIVADFMFLDSSGETISVAERQTSSSFKVLVLREAFSSSIGAVMITENIAKDRGLLLKWLAEFGLSSSQASIVLLTDSEEAVKSFVAGASDKYIFMVRKAAPQAHEQLGGAERTVRVLKEGLATLQSDFQSLGCVLSFRRDLLQLALSYLCMSVNSNGKAFGGERSPKEVAVGRRLPDTPFALFGSKVLAEVPESVKALCPNMSRFEAAAFLHPQFGSLGSLVYAHVRVGQVLTPKVFVAKSIKLVFPIELVFESGMFEVLRRRGELGPERPDHPVAPRILPSSQGASLKCPVSGPPKEFFERYGFSGECRACSNMAQFGSRKGSSHGRACCLRYEAWLRSQVATDDSMDVEVPVASDAEAMREALSELAEDESRQDRAVEEAQGSPLPPPANGDAASSEAPARIVSEAAPSGRVFTRGCPACESGMNAPGIRHNADCKRRNQRLSVRFSVSGEPDDDEASSRRLPDNLEGAAAPESEGIGALDEDTEMPFADPVLTGSEGGGSLEAEEVLRGSSAVKRSSEVPLEDLEREIRQDQERVSSVSVFGDRGPCLLLVYVDDFLCIAPTKEDADHIFEVIEKKVELKRTGLINSSKDGGGTLRFIGRVISRRKGESSITVSLPEDYLDETFKAYGLSGKGSSSPPDVAVHVEKQDGVPLSPEAYARFRSALGKVAWMTQTRQDLRAYVSILATQQATPTNHTEHGLRALLRFLKNDMCVVVRLPAASDVLAPSQHYQGKRHLVCFSDASHAPLRCTKRRGISGGVLTLDGCVIKTLCRHQQLVSLSSMESELFALQSVAQEMSSLGKFMARVFMSFRESEEVELPGILYSDSESALKLLRNLDTPRQSRHLEIRVEWLKARVAAGSLVLAFKKGIENPSDLLTKCLGSSAFGIHREALGFESLSGPLASLCNHEKRLVMVEVCCRPQSSVQGACRRVGMSYVGVTENMQSDSVFKEVRRYLLNFACDCVFVHVSTPCSSGSYLRRFSGGNSSKSDWEWFEVFPCVLKYLKLGKHSSFELPWNNEIWQHDLCQKVLKKAGHTFDVPVRLCMTGVLSMQVCGKLGGPKQVFTLRNSLMRLFEVRTRAAMVLTTDERRELRRLLDKMDSADGLASTANTSMTDGTKRLRDVGGYPEDGSTASGSACGAQLPISKGSAKGAVSTPKCYEDLVDAFEGEEFGDSDNVIVVSYAGTEVTSVPLPSNLSMEDWGRTICDLPKVQKNKMWFKKSYATLVKLAKEDSDLASYLNWIKEKFGRNYDPTTSSSQSSDLAGYLMRIGFSKQKGFQRKLAEE